MFDIFCLYLQSNYSKGLTYDDNEYNYAVEHYFKQLNEVLIKYVCLQYQNSFHLSFYYSKSIALGRK